MLSSIFVNVIKSEEEDIRLRLLKFIKAHIRAIPVELMNNTLKMDIENHVREVMFNIVDFDWVQYICAAEQYNFYFPF